MWLKGENKGVGSWKLHKDKQLKFKYLQILTVQRVILFNFLFIFWNKDDIKIDVLHYTFRIFVQCSLTYLIFLQPFAIV